MTKAGQRMTMLLRQLMDFLTLQEKFLKYKKKETSTDMENVEHAIQDAIWHIIIEISNEYTGKDIKDFWF